MSSTSHRGPLGATLVMTVVGMLLVGIGAIGRSWSLAYIAGQEARVGHARSLFHVAQPALSVQFHRRRGVRTDFRVAPGQRGIVILFALYYHFLIREEEALLRGQYGEHV